MSRRSRQSEASKAEAGQRVRAPADESDRGGPGARAWTPEEFDILRCAYIYANYEGMSQREVAEYLGVSAPTVARRLKEARDRGWLMESVAYRPPPHAVDMARYFGDPELQYELVRRLAGEDPNDILQRVEVIPAADTPNESRERCANVAARLLEETLGTGKHVLACNWGRTTQAIARALRPGAPNDQLAVIPIFGDLGVDPREQQFAEAHKYYANQVAELIAQRFGARIPVRLSFTAFIPPDIKLKELEAIRRYLRHDVSYQIVFGVESDDPGEREPGRIHEADTIISGVGAVEETNAWFQYAGALINTNLEEIGQEVVGDIAQHFVTIEGFPPLSSEDAAAKQDEITVDSRIVGLSPRHFQSLARRHARGDSTGLGVMIVAGGADKAAVTLAAVRSGAVNHLIVGEDLAAALLALEA